MGIEGSDRVPGSLSLQESPTTRGQGRRRAGNRFHSKIRDIPDRSLLPERPPMRQPGSASGFPREEQDDATSACIWSLIGQEQSIPLQSSPPNPADTEDDDWMRKMLHIKKLKDAAELKEKLRDWLTKFMLGSGIDVDDQKLTIFIPEDLQSNLIQHLENELKNIEPHLCNCYKISLITEPFSIERESQNAGAGSVIFYEINNVPSKVTIGAFFVNIINQKLYILTTCHLHDARGKVFSLTNEEGTHELGKCVAYICQTNPIIEACLVELNRDILDKCSSLISTDNASPLVAYRGPYRGSLPELLAKPQEVMKCGASTGITRGKMKYFAYDFLDPSTNTMIYGGIVTVPIDRSQHFSNPGDSGSIISTASCQSYFVDSWGINGNGNNLVERDALPCSASSDDTEVKNVAEASQDQTVPKTVGEDNRMSEVMAHEAISVHCFGYHMNIPEYGRVKTSVSFRATLAIDKLQEQIGAQLAMLPILKDSSHNPSVL